MLRLLYASVCTLDPTEAEAEVRSIVDISVRKNAGRGITGAFIYSGRHFAQALEGEEREVEKLMASIRSDARHCELRMIDKDNNLSRRFSGWSLAYQGQASYVDKPIERLWGAKSANARLRLSFEIYRIMLAFAHEIQS